MEAILIQKFKNIVGEEYVVTDAVDMASYGADRTTAWQPNPSLVVRPNSIEQVQKIVQLANQHQISLVPSGGRTGYSGGAVAKDEEVVVAMERMNRILHFSEADQSVTCEAGVITEHLQQFAAEKSLFYPVDFASSGSSHIGGNVATNAGGIHVIRYGGTREQVTGLKVVTGKGDILDLNRGLVKNNCGPDLRHLFIGSEGILGFIAEVTVKLRAPPPPQTVMVLSAQRITNLLAVFRQARRQFSVSAFELFSQQAMDAVTAHTGQKNPFAKPLPVYGLLEFDTPYNEDEIPRFFEHCLNKFWIDDAIIAQSSRQAKEMWQLREHISESLAPYKPLKNDIAVRLERLPELVERMAALFADTFPELQSVWFGHLGDGNIHLNVLQPGTWSDARFAELAPAISRMVLDLISELDGSISAEHGIGLLKKDYLVYCIATAEIAALKKLKTIYDPNGVINPGKVI